MLKCDKNILACTTVSLFFTAFFLQVYLESCWPDKNHQTSEFLEKFEDLLKEEELKEPEEEFDCKRIVEELHKLLKKRSVSKKKKVVLICCKKFLSAFQWLCLMPAVIMLYKFNLWKPVLA